jgi:type I restriction enzyme S subunit
MNFNEVSLYAPLFLGQWYKKPLYELADWLNGLAFKPADLGKFGTPVIKITEIKSGISQQTKYSSKKFDQKYLVKKGDMLFCWSGQPETSIDTFFWNGSDGWLNQHIFKVTPNVDLVSFDFFYYLLKYIKPTFISIASNKQTTGLGHVTKADLHRIEVSYPSLHTQNAIVETIKPIDDCINTIVEMNTTLEAMAQAIFKSWFVDFDPIHAKMEGRIPEGMNEVTAALFPDSFQESELGLIPKGWKVMGLDGIATYLNGLALQKFPPEADAWLPVIKIAQLRKGDTIGADRASCNLKPEYIVHDGDVLFSWSGSLEVEIWCGGDGALNQHLFKVTSPTYPKWFYYCWTRHHLAHFREVAAGKATTMGHIQRGHLSAAKVCVPSEQVLSAASNILTPIIEMIIENALEANNLAALRDRLLPSLISGQLRIPESPELALN